MSSVRNLPLDHRGAITVYEFSEYSAVAEWFRELRVLANCSSSVAAQSVKVPSLPTVTPRTFSKTTNQRKRKEGHHNPYTPNCVHEPSCCSSPSTKHPTFEEIAATQKVNTKFIHPLTHL